MKDKLPLAGITCALLLSGASAQGAQKVVGYSTSWSGEAAAVPMEKLTHLNYAFVVPRRDGSLPAVENPGKLTQLVSAAHRSGRKVLIAVGGWNDGDDSGFESLSASPAGRSNFLVHVLGLVKTYQLDGVDIDWEYPDSGRSSENFRLLMQELCGALHAARKLCTAAVTADGYYGSAIPAEVLGYVDYLNLMAYDGGDGASHSPYSFAVRALDYWRGRGLPAEKAILGVPFYGRPSWESYAAIVARDREAPYKDISNGVHYNGLDTMRAKAALALQRGGGVMIWELAHDTSNDTTSLLTALWSVVGPATAAVDPPPLTKRSPGFR